MAYENFKPTIWSKQIQLDLEKELILVSDCNRNYQGEAGMGKRVKIIGAARPTVKTYTPGTNIAAAETPPDTSIFLDVDQYKYTHFLVDDVDEAQSIEGLMPAYMKGSSRELADTRDAFVGSLAADATNMSNSLAITTAAAAKAAVEAAFVKLWENSVRIGDNVVIEVTPSFYSKFKDAITDTLTTNNDVVRKGVIGMYNGATVKMSNLLYNDGTDDYIMVRTKDAIAFAGGINKVEAYRPEKQFSDAIKALDTYGAKIVRPEELYVIKAHYTSGS